MYRIGIDTETACCQLENHESWLWARDHFIRFLFWRESDSVFPVNWSRMSPDHIQLLIADYLAKHYPSVLPSFLSAAHIALPLHPPQPDLETLIADIVSLEAVQPATTQTECTLQQLMMVQAAATLNQTHRTLEGISAANLLTVHVQPVPRRNFDTSTAS